MIYNDDFIVHTCKISKKKLWLPYMIGEKHEERSTFDYLYNIYILIE